MNRIGSVCVLGLVSMMAFACTKKDDGGTAGTSSATAATTTAATAAKKAKTTLKLSDLKKPWTAEIDNMAKVRDPMDKKVAAFLAKVPKPELDTPSKKTWYALDDAGKCVKVELDTQYGSLGDITTPAADCGM